MKCIKLLNRVVGKIKNCFAKKIDNSIYGNRISEEKSVILCLFGNN